MKVNLFNIFIEIAEKGINLLNKYGKIPGGQNGPYHDPETPVRNSSHWLILFAKLYEIENNSKYKDCVYKLAQFLISEDARPFGYSFHHRNKIKKDKCNGLIGQAWTIEALITSSKILEDEIYEKNAQEVFFQHPFKNKVKLWNRLEINGKILSIDGTFNHQLWFASSLVIDKNINNNEVKKRIDSFIDNISENLEILENGLIFHNIIRIWEKYFFIKYLYKTILKSSSENMKALFYRKHKCRRIRNIEDYKKAQIEREIYRSIGYHSFNLYAFAILKKYIPDHSFWEGEQFKKTLTYLLSKEYEKKIRYNIYGFSYNAPGFEIPFVLDTFFSNKNQIVIKQCEKWINWQFRQTYNSKTALFDRNNPDPLTLTSRFYELTRLSPVLFEKINVEI